MTNESLGHRPRLGDSSSSLDPQSEKRRRKIPGQSRKSFQDMPPMNPSPPRRDFGEWMGWVEMWLLNGELPEEVIRGHNLETDEIWLIAMLAENLPIDEVELPEFDQILLEMVGEK